MLASISVLDVGANGVGEGRLGGGWRKAWGWVSSRGNEGSMYAVGK